MNKKILKDTGFDKELENIENGLCATCGSDKVRYDDFKDSLSWKEFKISHMCQKCQNEVYE
jgi:hypothetical protein